MKELRAVLSVVVTAALCLGYAASQWAVFSGKAPEYARSIDVPTVKWIALCVLVVCIVFAFVRDNEANGT